MSKLFLTVTIILILLSSCNGTPAPQTVSGPIDTGTDAGIGTEVPTPPVADKTEEPREAEKPLAILPEEPPAPTVTPNPAASDQVAEKPSEGLDVQKNPPLIEKGEIRTVEPQGTVTLKPAVPESVTPKILEKKDLAAALMAASTATYSLIYHKTGPLIYFVDEDRDGLLDAGAVFVILKEGEAKAPDLMNMARLYNSQADLYDFYYQSFLQKGGVLRKHKSYFLGTHVVIQGMKEIRIKPEPGAINALSVVFPTTEGTEDEWMVFSPTGVSRFSLKENFSTYPLVYDPDEDGIQDIVIFSKSFEEGIGVETFITWYKWRDGSFKENSSVNIVRNLNLFLSRVKDLLIQNKGETFFEFALKPSDAAVYKQKIGGRENPLFSIFKPIAQEKPDEDLLIIKDLKIYDITFPEILENPFFQKSGKDYTFSPIIKLTTSAGAYFLTTTIKMASNPFTSPKQFYFLPQ